MNGRSKSLSSKSEGSRYNAVHTLKRNIHVRVPLLKTFSSSFSLRKTKANVYSLFSSLEVRVNSVLKKACSLFKGYV